MSALAARWRTAVAVAAMLAGGAPAAGVPSVHLLPQDASVADEADLLARVALPMKQAEEALGRGELEIAESRYRTALLEGWLLLGSLEVAESRLAGAAEALERAAAVSVETRRPLASLALVRMQAGQPREAVALLRRLLSRNPQDTELRRLLAQALVAAGRPGEAVQELEEARRADPDDLEAAYLLATAHLGEDRPEAAEPLFEELARRRPMAETWVLIGRTYRDFGDHERARTALRRALELDPGVRRARYYLGTIELLAGERAGLDAAVAHFRDELEVAPDDPIANLYLGMALVEGRNYREAIPHLEAATSAPTTRLDALHYLGRCHVGTDRPSEAARLLREALEAVEAGGEAASDDRRLASIHYQLALALRATGDREGAAHHFAEAREGTARVTEEDRERLTRYLEDEARGATAGLAPGTSVPGLDAPALAALDAAGRARVRRQLNTEVARAYLNLGVMQARQGHFARAGELVSVAADLDPGLPDVQRTLGVVRFNAGDHAAAAEPLRRALETRPDDGDVRRMLALAWLNAERYEAAADLLADDPRRAEDPSLEYAYAMSLVRSGRADEARPVFDRLMRDHADWPELHVLVGQARAHRGDYDGAVESLRRALELRPDVAEANATLAEIRLRQGRLDDAERALRAELDARPGDDEARHLLATVLDVAGRPDEAEPLLRALLESRPDHAGARYLLGKILLAEGEDGAALAHLEAAAELAPEDASVHYQLGRAYQKLGRAELAERAFATYRELKARQRGGRR